MRSALLLTVLLSAAAARADEGMWTYDNFPAAAVKSAYGFSPTQAWLDRARLSSVRLADGCSASFVSAQGLVMTNHHCAHDCIANLSTKTRDFVKDGFYAKTQDQEKACPGMELDRLVEIKDVTAEVQQATQGKTGEEYSKARKAALSRLEKSCGTAADVRCDVVTLYEGGKFDLYRYQRFQDVRLVFAPELSAAFFGGDPDNFNFPRYDLDMSFLRVYENGKPMQVKEFFPFSKEGAKEGQLTFVSGHPWSTARLLTPPELELARDVDMPTRLFWLSEIRGLLTEYQQRSAEAKRESTEMLFYVENGMKARKGMLQALQQPQLIASRAKELEDIRKKLAGKTDLLKGMDQALATIRERQALMREIYLPYAYLEGGGRSPLGFSGSLFSHARVLVRAAAELPKTNEERLREFTDANLPAIRQRVASTEPVHPDLEVETLTFSLTKLREALGADHPAVKAVLGKDSPRDVATKAVRGTRLADPKLRGQLLEGGAKRVDDSTDPMIVLARAVDPMARAVRKRYEDEVDGPMTRAHEALSKARFAALGTSVYPDATGTLRLSYGQVKGWTQPDGTKVEPFTTFAGAFDHATGKPPYDLPPSWIKAKPRIALDTRLNQVTTNDIIGGNSGSPVIDQDAHIVGLIFDGNIHSLGGDYFFDPALNRAVAVHSAGILEALGSVYGARRLIDELRGESATAKGSAGGT
jgi:hypothetical protein